MEVESTSPHFASEFEELIDYLPTSGLQASRPQASRIWSKPERIRISDMIERHLISVNPSVREIKFWDYVGKSKSSTVPFRIIRAQCDLFESFEKSHQKIEKEKRIRGQKKIGRFTKRNSPSRF